MRMLYHEGMKAGQIVREARRRAGLTQRRLAEAVGVSQPTVARIESGTTQPSFALVARLVEACGLELGISLAVRDESDWSVASVNLRLGHDARVRQHQAALRFARAGRKARGHARA
jgi:transcriptional regulator with XRE-family HTH domain